MTLIFVTITRIFKISVIVICVGAKMGRLESLNLDFYVFNYDTAYQISFAKVPKSLVLSYFLTKEKERKYRINTCVPIWCGQQDLNLHG